MQKLGLLLLPILAITLMLGGNAFATGIEGGDYSDYFVTYYSNANTSGAPDGTLRIVNDGDYATTAPGLWAAIYVFDDSQEMRSCCACYVSADGLLSESVNKELTANEFTGRGQIARGSTDSLSTHRVTHCPEVQSSFDCRGCSVLSSKRCTGQQKIIFNKAQKGVVLRRLF